MFCPWRRPWESKMDSLQVSLVVLGLVLVLGAQSGNSLSCYQCNSGKEFEGEACGDEFNDPDDNFLKDCSEENYTPKAGSNFTVCRKIKQEVEGEVRIHRQCGTDWRSDRPCVERTGSEKVKAMYCECNTDGCNSAPSVFSVQVVLVSALSALLALILHS